MSEYHRNQAFMAGLRAGQEGKPETANTRQRGTIYFDDWWDGWNEGRQALAKNTDSPPPMGEAR